MRKCIRAGNADVSPLVIFAIFCAKCFLVFPVLGGSGRWALRV